MQEPTTAENAETPVAADDTGADDTAADDTTAADTTAVADPAASEDAGAEEAGVEEAADVSTTADQAEQAVSAATDQVNEAIGGVFESIGIPPELVAYVVPAITALLLLIVGYFIAKFLSRIAGAPIKKRVDETLGRFVSKIIFYGVMTCVLLAVLGSFGIPVTSFAAILGAAGFAVGLAFQGTLSNFAAGVLLLVFRPYKVGDVINAAGVTAKVTDLDLFTTVLNTPDNRRIIVPNSEIASGTIENITYHNERRIDVSVGVDYGASIDATRAALATAAEKVSDRTVQGEGRGFAIVLGDLGDSAVNWTVRVWSTGDDFWGVKEDLTQAVKESLEAANIGIPYPTMDVNVTNNS